MKLKLENSIVPFAFNAGSLVLQLPLSMFMFEDGTFVLFFRDLLHSFDHCWKARAWLLGFGMHTTPPSIITSPCFANFIPQLTLIRWGGLVNLMCFSLPDDFMVQAIAKIIMVHVPSSSLIVALSPGYPALKWNLNLHLHIKKLGEKSSSHARANI